jgi:methanogenic corrinoid protein MtbC1
MLPADQFIFSIVLPLLRETGWRWQGGGIRPAHEHLLTAVIRSMLGAMLRTVPRVPGAPVMMFATPAGERHELGLLAAAVLAAQAGYAVLYLGPDLPGAEIATAATRSRARVVVLAATSSAALAADDVAALRRLASRIAVWTGGAQGGGLGNLIGKGVHVMDDLNGFATRVTSRDR